LNATSDKLVVGGLYTGGAGRVIDLGSVTSSQAILYTVLTAGAAPFPFGTNNTGWTQSVSGNNIQLLGTASITAIPTLTEWGLIIFALLIATFALRSMRMKKYKTA
jgi:hypothetical protein